jgi:hypothetical protein
MSKKPERLVAIDALVNQLRGTLARSKVDVPPSMSGLICGFVSYYLRKRLAGFDVVHPGVDRASKWGKCSIRQTQRNLRVIEQAGIVTAISDRKGGRWATRYIVDFKCLAHWLIGVGANPSESLVSRLSDEAWGDMRGDIQGAVRGDICHDTMSPGIQLILETSFPQAKVLPFPSRAALNKVARDV